MIDFSEECGRYEKLLLRFLSDIIFHGSGKTDIWPSMILRQDRFFGACFLCCSSGVSVVGVAKLRFISANNGISAVYVPCMTKIGLLSVEDFGIIRSDIWRISTGPVSIMFFIMGINQKSQKLNFDQLIVCGNCGRYGHLEVYLTYSCLSLFFIPVFKWGRTYYVKTSCCNKVIPIDHDLGYKIESGQIHMLPETVIPDTFQQKVCLRHCRNCSFETTEDFKFCPKCGEKLV